jgi:hypothetical protein
MAEHHIAVILKEQSNKEKCKSTRKSPKSPSEIRNGGNFTQA